MAQWFALHNLDREENYCRRSIGPDEEMRDMVLAELFFKQDHQGLIDNLRLPCLTGLTEAEKWLGPLEDLTPLEGCSLSKMLPIELLRMICDHLAWEEVICLALTTRQFFELLKPRLLKILQCIHPSWAGCRLICIGDGAEGIDDLPAGLLSPLERQEYLDGRKAAMINHPGESLAVDLRIYSVHMHDFAFKPYATFRADTSTRLRAAILRDSGPGPRGRAYADWAVCRAILGTDGARAPYPAIPGPLVLFNLSKWELVHEERLRARVGAPAPVPVTLAHALLALVCWTANTATGMACEDAGFAAQLARGRWAGDRVCIGTEEQARRGELFELAKECGVGGVDAQRVWGDVTEGVGALLRHLCEQNPNLLQPPAAGN
ncbi:hypothetical protein C8Q78DRAFT_1149863 [Trametes maxima]|nr:hypothetical protein C8Q78DRAFT_1149863 [Trametes maxima]